MANGQPLAIEPGSHLFLSTLGRASLSCARDSCPRSEILGPGKPLALFTYLALSPGRTASRDHLANLLWADLDPEAARHAVRTGLWYLRQRLGENAIATHEDRLRVAAEVEVDCAAFLQAV